MPRNDGFNDNGIEPKKIAKYIGIACLVILGLIVLFGSFYTIGAGEKGVLLTWGNPSVAAMGSGFHMKIPIAQEIIKVNIQTQKYEADASAASSDLQIVSTKIAVNYHLNGDNIVELYKSVGLSFGDKIIQPAVQEVVKASTAQFTAEQLITKRDAVKEKIDAGLKDRLKVYGIFLETTSITNFDFSKQFNDAIEAKVTAEQQALTEKNLLAKIQYEAQQKVAEANGTAESLKLNAAAQANAKLIVAEAEAKALELQKQQASDNVLELRRIEVQKSYSDKWNGQLPVTVIGGSGAIPLLQLPTSIVAAK